jgi:hypothetical protein
MSAGVQPGNSARPRGHSTAAAYALSDRQRLASGDRTARQPIAPLSPVPAQSTGFRPGFAVISAAVAGQLGRYTATTLSGLVNRTPSGAFAAGDLGAAAGSVDCEVWCLADVRAGFATLKAGDLVEVLFGPTKDASDTIIGVCGAAGPDPAAMYAVDIEQTGGSAGDRTTPCSFTYSLTAPDGTTASGVTPLKPRPSVGAMIAGTCGYLRRASGGGWQLLDAQEVLDTEACPEEGGGA